MAVPVPGFRISLDMLANTRIVGEFPWFSSRMCDKQINASVESVSLRVPNCAFIFFSAWHLSCRKNKWSNVIYDGYPKKTQDGQRTYTVTFWRVHVTIATATMHSLYCWVTQCTVNNRKMCWKCCRGHAAVLSHNVAELNLSVSTMSTYLGLQGRGSSVTSGAVHLVSEEISVKAAGVER
jgi:hypothetical protein